MVLPLLGYFFCMIAVLTAVVWMMLGFSNISSERVRHYPRAVVERNVTAANREPRLFMMAPETKDGSSAKNMEANSAVAPTEKTVAKKGRPRKPTVLARQRQNYEGRGYAMSSGIGGYSRALELDGIR